MAGISKKKREQSRQRGRNSKPHGLKAGVWGIRYDQRREVRAFRRAKKRRLYIGL